jgi:ketosteroid isomerase-like protein
MSAANVELARRGYEAAARGDLEAIGAILDPAVKWHGGDPTAAGACQNRDQALRFMREAGRRRGLGELVELVDAGDRVVVIMRRTGPDGGTELVANLTTFQDGMVVEMVHYPDVEQALADAGVRRSDQPAAD